MPLGQEIAALPIIACLNEAVEMRFIHPLLILSLLATTPQMSLGDGGEAKAPDISEIEQLLNTEVTTVTGASKYQQDLAFSPASVTILTAEDLRRGGYRNIAEALNNVRGLYVTGDRAYSFVGVHGFSPLGDYNARILALVDGHRLNDGVYEEARLGSYFPVDLDLVERIEVIRGPGSSMYGTNAFLGVVNVITRKGVSVKGAQASVSGGSFDTWTYRATGGGKTDGDIDFLVSASYRDSAGQRRLSFPEYSSTNGGIAEGIDGENSWDLLATATWKDISLIALHQTRSKEVPTAEYGTIFNNPNEEFTDEITLLGLNYRKAGELVDFSSRLTYNRYGFLGDYPYDYDGTPTINRDKALAEWIGTDFFINKNVGDHLFTVGMEHRWQFTEKQKNYDVTPTTYTYLDDNHQTFVQGYYMQDEWHLLRELVLNIGARYDHYNTFGGTMNPRIALI